MGLSLVALWLGTSSDPLEAIQAGPTTLAPAAGGPGADPVTAWRVEPWQDTDDNLDLTVGGSDFLSLGWPAPLAACVTPRIDAAGGPGTDNTNAFQIGSRQSPPLTVYGSGFQSESGFGAGVCVNLPPGFAIFDVVFETEIGQYSRVITVHEREDCEGATATATVFYDVSGPVISSLTLSPASGGPGTSVENVWQVGPWHSDADNLDLTVSGSGFQSVGWFSITFGPFCMNGLTPGAALVGVFQYEMESGRYSTRIVAYENEGCFTPDRNTQLIIYYEVSAPNAAPTFTELADPVIVDVDSGAASVDWATDIGSNLGGELTGFQRTGNTNPALFSVQPAVSLSGTLTFTPAAGVGGSATVTFVLKDDGGTANGGVDTSLYESVTIIVREAGEGAAFVVDTTDDVPDGLPGDGACATAAGRCSLRAAIQEANEGPDRNLIFVPSGTYRLMLLGTGEQDAATGDLDVHADLTIMGAGRELTVIDGARIDRVLQVGLGQQDPISLKLQDLTIANGFATDRATGGGVDMGRGIVTIERVRFLHNEAISNGGGLSVSGLGGPLVIRDSVFEGNVAGGAGGGFSSTVETTVTNTLVIDNTADQAGGIRVSDSVLTIDVSTVANNSAERVSGIDIFRSGALIATNVTVSGNRSVQTSVGAISAPGDDSVLTHVTIVNNEGGFGIGQASNTMRIRNSIVAGNGRQDCAQARLTLIREGVNLDSDGTCGFSLRGEPELSELGHLGGPPQLLAHDLLPGSLAIDAAISCLAPVDAIGTTRPVGAGCDLGAIEARAPAALIEEVVRVDDDRLLDADGNPFYEVRSSDGSATIRVRDVPADAGDFSVDLFLLDATTRTERIEQLDVADQDLVNAAAGVVIAHDLLIRDGESGAKLPVSIEIELAPPVAQTRNSALVDRRTRRTAAAAGVPRIGRWASARRGAIRPIHFFS